MKNFVMFEGIQYSKENEQSFLNWYIDEGEHLVREYISAGLKNGHLPMAFGIEIYTNDASFKGFYENTIVVAAFSIAVRTKKDAACLSVEVSNKELFYDIISYRKCATLLRSHNYFISQN